MDTIQADEIIHQNLVQANASLGQLMAADVVILMAPMMMGVDDIVRAEIERLHENPTDGKAPSDHLAVILETGGGYIETVERIVSVFRRHYSRVSFIIPSFAYSAGTILALSGDEIHMDYYSVLGPIDPQFSTEDGDTIPGMGYLAKYNELLETINTCPAGEEGSIRAELSFLLKKFDPAKLFHIEQSIEHAEALIESWLPAYKFKNWATTETNGAKVTLKMKRERAKKIARVLGDAKKWHSHGRGISMAELESDRIGLKVNDFGADAVLNNHVRHYHGLFTDFVRKLGMESAIHTRFGVRRVR